MWRQRAATESNLRASTPLGPDARRHSFSIPPKLHRVDEENESSNATPRKKSVSWGSELNHAGHGTMALLTARDALHVITFMVIRQ